MSAAPVREVAVPAPVAHAFDPQHWTHPGRRVADPGVSSFEGWFASSRDLLSGLLVQPLRIDPRDPLWGELFSAA